MPSAKLVPELFCSAIELSLAFYVEMLGFNVSYARPEEGFFYLEREGAELMLDHSTTRRLVNSSLQQPYGRGINLQIKVTDVQALHDALIERGGSLFLPLEGKWYRRDDELVGNCQFVVEDPDGYLLRFYQDMGTKSADASG